MKRYAKAISSAVVGLVAVLAAYGVMGDATAAAITENAPALGTLLAVITGAVWAVPNGD